MPTSISRPQPTLHSAHASTQPTFLSACCCSIPYTLECIRDGSSLGQKAVAAKDHYSFGRIPSVDFCLEHPSASRLHAVIQYKAGSGQAFLYDGGSTHGTFLNKQRLKPRTHVLLRWVPGLEAWAQRAACWCMEAWARCQSPPFTSTAVHPCVPQHAPAATGWATPSSLGSPAACTSLAGRRS
jgi:hypothetical protein